MKRAYLFLLVCIMNPLSAQDWPLFRGPNGSAVMDGLDLPLVWNAETGENLKWKARVPGLGHSSPVVWGGRVFLTTAVSSSADSDVKYGHAADTVSSAEDQSTHAWKVLALDLQTGTLLWEQDAYVGTPLIKRHAAGTYANATPAVDAEHVVAFFGSHGLYCFDHEGGLLWKKDLGVINGGWSTVPQAEWGFGSSPVIDNGLVFVQCDAQNTSFVAAFRLSNGEEVWRMDRGEDTVWASPTVCAFGGGHQLILNGTKFFRAYDPGSGSEVWRFPSGVDVKIATPVCTERLALLGGGDSNRESHFYAIAMDSRGEIKEDVGQGRSGLVWKNRARPHVPTPLVYQGGLHVGRRNGVLTRYELDDGKRTQRIRVGGGITFTSSPVASDGRLFWACEEGEVFVVDLRAEKPKVVARNEVGEVVTATPALSSGTILIRGRDHLFAFAEQP